jgi:hypothetical protein
MRESRWVFLLIFAFLLLSTGFFWTPDNILIFVFMLSSAVCAVLLLAHFSDEVFFYTYLCSLFYMEYLKLIFPVLPLGIIPDVLFFLLCFKLLLTNTDRVLRVFGRKGLFLPNVIGVTYLLFNFSQIFNQNCPNLLLGIQLYRSIFKIVLIFWITLLVLNSEKRKMIFLRFLRINIFIIFLFSFKQLFFGFFPFELTVYCPGTIRRIYSLVSNAAVFSVILGVGAVELYLSAIFKKEFKLLYLSFLYLCISLTSLHRAPFVATCVALIFVSILNFEKVVSFFLREISKVMVFLLILIAVGGCIYFLLPSKLAAMRGEIITRYLSMKAGVEKTSSIRTRIDQIEEALVWLRDYPFGCGLGYTQLRFGKRFDTAAFFKGLNNSNYTTRIPMGTGDSTFLTIFIETGIWGVLCFLIPLTYFMGCLFINILLKRSKSKKMFQSFALSMALIITISVTVSSIYFILMVGTLLWISFAFNFLESKPCLLPALPTTVLPSNSKGKCSNTKEEKENAG